MRFLAQAASVLVLISTAIAGPIDAATNNVTAPFTNQSVTDMDRPNAARCITELSTFRRYYEIKIDIIPNSTTTGEICHKLWDGLRGHPMCAVVTSPHGCGVDRKGDSMLEWYFHGSAFCDRLKVEAAFMWATTGEFGVISCPD